MNSTTPRPARVITVSDRSAAGIRPDRSGPMIVEALTEAGFDVSTDLVSDGIEPVTTALREAIRLGAQVIITTGGTGVAARDRTPEATAAVIDRDLPGVAEALRSRGLEQVVTASLSRGVAGVVDARDGHPGAFVVNLPGSTGGVRDGLTVVLPLIEHVLHQLEGFDH